MKTILLSLSASIDGETSPATQSVRDKSLTAISEAARSQADAGDATRAFDKVVGDFNAGAESATRSAAAALVASLRAAGLNIQTATLQFAVSQGAHERPEVIDLNAPEATPELSTSPRPSPQGGEGEEKKTETAVN